MDKSKTLQKFEQAIHPIDRFLQKFLSPAAPYVVEFAGTFFLILVITTVSGMPVPAGTLTTTSLLAPLAIGFTLMVGIFAGGHVSGGHYNPAVTLSVLLSGRSKITPKSAIIYVIMQLFASIVASLTSWVLIQNTAAPAVGAGYTMGEALFAETLWTFFLCTTVLNVATTKSQEGNSFFGHAIGFCVVSGAITMGPISGGAFNPAVAFGPIIVNGINQYYLGNSLWDAVSYIWVYWVAATIAALLAPVIFRITSHKEYVGASTGGMMEEDVSLVKAAAHQDPDEFIN